MSPRDAVGAIRLARQGQPDQAVWWLIGCLALRRPALLAPAVLAKLHPIVKSAVRAGSREPVTAGRVRRRIAELEAAASTLGHEAPSLEAALPVIRLIHRRHERRRRMATIGAGAWLACGWGVHRLAVLLVGDRAPVVLTTAVWLALMGLLLAGPLVLWWKSDIRLGAYGRVLRSLEPPAPAPLSLRP